MVKIKDVAAKAGVSVSTVSYVINGKAEQIRISEVTQKKVWEAVEELNYRPNMQAKKLKTGQAFSPTYAVLWNERANSNLLERFMSGVQEAREKEKLSFEIVIYPYNHHTLADACNYLKKSYCSGAIWLGVNMKDVEYAEKQDFSIPMVVFVKSEKFNSVIIDDEKIGIIAAEHMADCGCKEIVVIQRVKFMDDAEGRVTNFQQRCMDLGVNVYIQDKEYEYSIEGGMKAAMEAVRDYPKVDGLYYLMDIMAAGGVNWLSFHRGEIGRQVKVMSHGNAIFSKCTYPQITVTNMPIEEMAAEGIRILPGKNNSNVLEQTCVKLPTTLIERESCTKKRWEKY